MRHFITHPFTLVPLIALLTACGGGGTGPDGASAQVSESPADTSALAVQIESSTPGQLILTSTSAVADSRRISAATATAKSDTNACAPIRPFYWEVGNRSAKSASGSVKSSTSATAVSATMPMSIASASKWIYGAYVVQRRNGALNADDVAMLGMRSGYTNFNTCLTNQTVDTCLAYGTNGVFSAATSGKFDYDGGHMQKHASSMGLGVLNNKSLASEIQAKIGTDVQLGFSQPQLAGGIFASPDAYARFLRKIMGGQLKIGAMLGANPVCANRAGCPAGQVLYTPVPSTESWHYSIGHWVEDDPKLGDGAFSSPGAYGFYPWIDASRTVYGIVARNVPGPGGGVESVGCGRLIRKAWLTGNPS